MKHYELSQNGKSMIELFFILNVSRSESQRWLLSLLSTFGAKFYPHLMF